MPKRNNSKKSSRVAVIMSTYNGKKYLKEQLDSILRQTYPDIDIYIRDDGSQDNTIRILHEYTKKHKNIRIEKGDNLGFTRSFMRALEAVDGYDYYAFCDQDDVWLEFKIERAVMKLDGVEDQSRPVIYFSNYDFYDAEMNLVSHFKGYSSPPSFQNALMESRALGACTVINSKARELMLKEKSDICGHDWWAYIICAGLGEVIYDPIVTMKYRRDGNNASVGGKSFLGLQIYRVKTFLFGEYPKRIKRQNENFARLFRADLSKQDQAVLASFIGRNNLEKIVKKTFYPRRYRQSLVDEILLRFLLLIGKF